jgi:hypothetical protein
MNRADLKRAVRRLRSLEWLGNKAKENDEATNTAVRSLIGIENSIEDMKNDIDKLSTFNEKRSSTTSYQKGYEIGLQAGMEKALKILYKNLDYKEDNST